MANGQLGSVLRHIRRLVTARTAEGLTDRQLLKRFAVQRDETSFAALVERHGSLVLGVCRRILANPHDADGAFQATFLVLARKAGSAGWQESVGNWLYGVALRIALKARGNLNRRQAREQGTGPTMAASSDPLLQHPGRDGDPMVEVARRELQRVLDEELNQLPLKYRAPLVMCYLEGKTNEEAARQLGWPAGSMSRHLARGRELLRQRLTNRGVALSAGMLVTVLAENGWGQMVAGGLADSTVQAAVLYAGGTAAGAGLLSAEAVVLAEGILKAMFTTKLKIALATLLIIGLAGSGRSVFLRQADASQPAAADEKKEDKEPSSPAAPAVQAAAKNSGSQIGNRATSLREKLDLPIDLERGLDANTPLRDALEFLSDRYDLTIIVDTLAFKDDDQVEDIDVVPMRLPRMRGVPLSTVLAMLMEQINGAFLVRRDYVEVTTRKRGWPEEWTAESRHLVPRVSVRFENRTLDQALQELAHRSGINVLVDGRVAEGARQTPVTAALNNTLVDTAVRLLADMGDLKSVAIDNVLYVTTIANADALQTEQEARRHSKQEPAKGKKPAPAKSQPQKAGEKKIQGKAQAIASVRRPGHLETKSH
jgi:RNA polymerase sigma factor (sigma-70 family)